MKILLNDIFPFEEITRKYGFSIDRKEIMGFPVIDYTPGEITVTHHKNRKVDISADIKLTLMCKCDRCLMDVPVIICFMICRSVDLLNGLDEDGYPIFFNTEDGFDFDELLLEEIQENLPMKVLCKEDCKGICFRCGANLNVGKCSCESDRRPTKMEELLKGITLQ